MFPVSDNIGQYSAPAAQASDNDQWRTAPPLDATMLTGTFWALADINGKKLTPFLVLAPQGLVGNFNNPSVDLWQIINGVLCLVDNNGIPSVAFTAARIDNSSIVALAGQGTIDGVEALYTLTVAFHPDHPLFATPATTDRRAKFLKRPEDGPTRANLVIVPAGRDSLHPHWLKDMDDANRNWDLCIGYYGTETPQISTPHEYLAHIPATKKFRIFYNLLYAGSPLWNYESIWLPDDDLLCSGTDINHMFHIFRKQGLDLAQPSLKSGDGSHPNHPLTIQRPGSFVRNETFVEIMCPLFSNRALRICVDSMRDVDSGYGLDHLWPAFLGRPRSRMGIIDAIAVSHTRPIGATYNIQSAINEQAQLFQAYWHRYAAVAGVK